MKTFSILTLVAMQVFHYLLARFLIWLLALQSHSARIWVYCIVFLLGNGLMLTTLFMRIHALFRITAAWLALLLFVAFTGAIVLFLEHICRLLFKQPQKRERALRILSPLILLGFIGIAIYNAYTPVVRYAKIQLAKPLSQPLRIAMASDLHLGILVGARQLDKLAQIVHHEKAEIVLLPGDIMDDDTVAYDAENMQPHLQKLRAPLGVYATLGNHDLMGHESEITQALENAGIQVLYDQAIQIHDFWIVGRPDNLDRQRKKTIDLLQQTNPQQVIILLDHRPDAVTEHSNLPLDIQVSGHVHNGQIFPANLIVRYLNRIAYGYENINNKHFFVSSGFGFWGIPFRLGSQSEVWIIDVIGK